MPAPKEASAIAAIFTAANKLSNDYAVPGGSENRRDQLKPFISAVMNAVAKLAEEAGADPLTAIYSLDSVLQDIDEAFVDAVDEEDRSEPRIDPVREWGTYNARAL